MDSSWVLKTLHVICQAGCEVMGTSKQEQWVHKGGPGGQSHAEVIHLYLMWDQLNVAWLLVDIKCAGYWPSQYFHVCSALVTFLVSVTKSQ